MPYPEDLLAAEDNAAAQLEKEFLDSVKVTVKQIDWDKLEKDLADHAAGADIVDGLPWEEYDPEKVLKNLFEAGLEVHGEYIGSVKGGAIFDYVDPHALDWISQYGADEIKYISDSQKEAIKKIILDGYQNGVTVKEQARQIREHIGLDPQRFETLQKYAENLFAKGKSEAEVWRLVEKRGKALLMSRANTIAVNEASEAAGRAAYESTKSAVMRGVIDPNLYEGFRIVTGDDRTCTACMDVEGEARTLPDGTYPSSGSQIAKKHTCCRCVEGLREIKRRGDSLMHFDSIQIGGHIVEKTDLITVVSGRLMEEGVQNGGLKRWESFCDPEGLQGCMWFEGVPIVKYAHPPGKVDGSMELAGRVRAIKPDPNTRAVFAEFVLFNSHFSNDEMKLIDSGEFIGGSIGYDCGYKPLDDSQIWQPTGEEYIFEYMPPFYGDHFAIFVNPACAACGLNADSKHDGCKCSRKKEELKMTEKPPAQAGTEGAPAQAGSLSDEGKSAPSATAQQKTQGDQMDPEALKIKAQTVLAIQDEYVRAKEAMALLLEFVTGEAPSTPAPGMGDSLMDKLTALEKKIDTLAADNKRLTEAENARIQADAAARDAADSAALKANFDQAYQIDWDAKHWPSVKATGINAFLADSENAKHWVGPQAAQKIEPTGQRFVSHPGADEEGSEYDVGIDAALKGVR